MINGIDHLELVVCDVERTVSFFVALGFELIRRTDHHGGSAELRAPGAGGVVLEVHKVGAEENPGFNHLALRCDDVEATFQELVEKGIAFEDNPPGWGAPFFVEDTKRWVANLRTPDGLRLQLSSVPSTGAAPER